MDLTGREIVLGVTGGIAAYKSAEIVSRLRHLGARVHVIMTRNATEFVSPLTFQTLSANPVVTDTFAAPEYWNVEHVALARLAEVFVIAPATANVLAKTAVGIADDALTTTYAACIARKPIVVAPAMNDKMYAAPATQKAFRTLVEQGVHLLDCAEGFLACGADGKGRMQELEAIMEAVQTALTPQSLTGHHILITAGPTRERIDPVRYVSNDSSGKMGFAIARECLRRGARVTLISGPTHERIVPVTYIDSQGTMLNYIPTESAEDMYVAAIKVFLNDSQVCVCRPDAVVLSAAVADFTPAEPAAQKRKKEPGQTEMQLRMVLTHDIAAELGKRKRDDQYLVGFALETENELQNAQAKLLGKNLDMIVLNSLRDAGAGFGTDTNKVTLITRQSKENLPLLSKQEVASRIIDAIESNFFS